MTSSLTIVLTPIMSPVAVETSAAHRPRQQDPATQLGSCMTTDGKAIAEDSRPGKYAAATIPKIALINPAGIIRIPAKIVPLRAQNML